MSHRGSLPQGWAEASLSDASEVLLGSSPAGSSVDSNGLGLPFFQGKGEFGSIHPTPKRYCHAPVVIAQRGDVLVSVRAPVGPSNLCQADSCIGRGLAALRPSGGMDPMFLLYAIRATEHQLARVATGTTFSAVTGLQLRSHRIRIAPVKEQKRIVQRIVQLTTDLDRAIEALTQSKENLARYRESVLQSAVTGALTAEWRKTNPAKENGKALLDRILRERRERWEKEQLASFAAKGKQPTKGWQDKYEEPPAPDTTQLPELPEEWVWARFAQIADEVTVGHVGAMKHRYVSKGIPFLRSQNIRPLNYSKDGLLFVAPDFHTELRKSRLIGGELLVVRSGNIGDACVYPPSEPEANCADLVIARLNKEVNPYFAAMFVGSPMGRSSVLGKRTGSALGHFNVRAMSMSAVPLPPLSEQEKIVQIVDDCLRNISQTALSLGVQETSASRLRQSILKAAFEGRLVPQDPNDEPASALLERIRAKSSTAIAPKTKITKRRKAAAK